LASMTFERIFEGSWRLMVIAFLPVRADVRGPVITWPSTSRHLPNKGGNP